jgi:tetratricopeptide (TPR) repeat protein
MNFRSSVVLIVVSAACATAPAVDRAVTSSQLSNEEAEAIIARYQNRRELRHAEVAQDPLGQPKSLDDVLEILRRDQIDFFPEAMKFASTQEGPRALALRAQIELAWGEAQMILDEMLQRSTARLRREANALEASKQAGALSDADQATLARLRKNIEELSGIGEALVHVGGQHISAGAALTDQLIAQAPNDYQGYRVAADLYRLRNDWPHFDQAVAKLEETNPKSNGLLFARGMEALNRKQDRSAAMKYFDEALEKDPKFARALVERMLAQTDLIQARDEMNKLKEISPHHQLVVWVGPAVESVYQAWAERVQARNQLLIDRANLVQPR